jgi:hypothetical protein
MRTFCIVCSSSQQALIDHRLLDGESLRTLSADLSLGEVSITDRPCLPLATFVLRH